MEEKLWQMQFLSFFIPELCQSVVGDIKKGIVLFIGDIVLGLLLSSIFRHGIVMIIDLIYSL